MVYDRGLLHLNMSSDTHLYTLYHHPLWFISLFITPFITSFRTIFVRIITGTSDFCANQKFEQCSMGYLSYNLIICLEIGKQQSRWDHVYSIHSRNITSFEHYNIILGVLWGQDSYQNLYLKLQTYKMFFLVYSLFAIYTKAVGKI